jgi:hypothetical protein
MTALKDKPTVYDQEDPEKYIPPAPQSDSDEGHVVQFPDRIGERLDDDRTILSAEAWRRFSNGEKAVIYTIAATMIGALVVSANKPTLGQGLVDTFHKAESLVGITQHSDTENSLKSFTASNGKRINITSA